MKWWRKLTDTNANCFQRILEAQLDFLSTIVSDISDPELQARVADILWVKRRDYRSALTAIPAYLQSAIRLEDPMRWTRCIRRIERALRLAHKIRNREQADTIFAYIEAVLDRYKGEDERWLSVKLMELLQEFKHGDPDKYADLSRAAAEVAESRFDWRKARHLWNIEAVWHRINKENEHEFAASMKAAETYEKEAESALENRSQGYFAASAHLQKAVAAFRSIRGTSKERVRTKNERAEAAHQRLIEYQKKISDDMTTHSQSIDVGPLMRMAEQEVSGKSFQEAAFALAMVGAPTNVAQLRQQVEEYANSYIASHVAPVAIMNEEGKVVSRQPGSVLFGDFETREAATKFEMFQHATRFNHGLQAQACIEPARYQITLEHCIHIKDVLDLVTHSPFVPPGREFLFAKGIHAGFTGDFVTATHLLIPQIENSIRYIMNAKGIITSGLDDNGIQQEHNLNSTLYRSEISSILDEDTLFDLRCLLVEHAGSNLRNQMAHGLISDTGFSNPVLPYVWWLTLRLCCIPMINQLEAESANSSESETVQSTGNSE